MIAKRTARYAAQQAYRLMMFNGRYQSRYANLDCKVEYVDGAAFVTVNDGAETLTIKAAKSWL